MAVLLQSDESESEPEHVYELENIDPLFDLILRGVISKDNILHKLPRVYSKPEIVIVISDGLYQYFDYAFEKYSSLFSSGEPSRVALNSVRFLENLLLNSIAFEDLYSLLSEYARNNTEHIDEMSAIIFKSFGNYFFEIVERTQSKLSNMDKQSCLIFCMHIRLLRDLSFIKRLGISEHLLLKAESLCIDVTEEKIKEEVKGNYDTVS